MNAAASILILFTATLQTDIDKAEKHLSDGMAKFTAGDVQGSLEDFDKTAELAPALIPRLWQRGISQYYAGLYQEGREQFEIHKTVNPNDVENATWHYLCVAKLEGVDAARKALIPIDTKKDSRVPLKEVYELYAGQGSVEQVLQRAKQFNRPMTYMYANLYIGLYYEAAGDVDQAKKYMQAAAAAIDLREHYMQRVAKVHLQQRGWQPARKAKKADTKGK